MRALLGLCYMRGLLGANLTKVNELWGADFSVIFAATMSCHRFKFLLSHLRYVSTFYGPLHIFLFQKSLKNTIIFLNWSGLYSPYRVLLISNKFWIGKGSIFWSKTDIYSPPPSKIYIFSQKNSVIFTQRCR